MRSDEGEWSDSFDASNLLCETLTVMGIDHLKEISPSRKPKMEKFRFMKFRFILASRIC